MKGILEENVLPEVTSCPKCQMTVDRGGLQAAGSTAMGLCVPEHRVGAVGMERGEVASPCGEAGSERPEKKPRAGRPAGVESRGSFLDDPLICVLETSLLLKQCPSL